MKPFSQWMVVSFIVVSLSAAAGAQIWPVSYSLDDNPAAPLTSPPGVIPGFGAEDPYGLGTYGPSRAPSPSLIVGPYQDDDLLRPTAPFGGVPAWDVIVAGRGYLDAVSDNANRQGLKAAKLSMAFSVDRITTGVVGSAVNIEALNNQQPADIFRSNILFAHPKNFVGMLPPNMGYLGPLPTAGVGGSNILLANQGSLSLAAGMGVGAPIPPGVPAPPIVPGSHDNIDGLTWGPLDITGDGNTDKWTYWSFNPDVGRLLGVPWSAADILDIAPGGGAVPTKFATGFQMGLDRMNMVNIPNIDNIDGLVVWDRSLLGGPGWGGPGAQPGMDYALFSLSHGSSALATYGLSPGDIFFTDFNGTFALYATAADLGLIRMVGKSDNIDALEVLVPGDANLDRGVDVIDLGILATHYGSINSQWIDGDFNGDGKVDVIDLGVLATNYGNVTSIDGTLVPEPIGMTWLLVWGLLIRRR
jgi:hypothetical protein